VGVALIFARILAVCFLGAGFLDASFSANYGIVRRAMLSGETSVAPSILARSTRADQALLFFAAFLRSLVIGMTGVLLAIYLSSSGWDVKAIGTLVTAGLAGNAAATLLISLLSARAGSRKTLAVLALLNAAGLLGLALMARPSLLLLAAFVGMVNGLGRDRGPAYALEQAILPQTTTAQRRTFLLAWYALTLDGGLALGSLLAGVPHFLRVNRQWASGPAYHSAWILAACLSLLSAVLSASLSSRMEFPRSERSGSLSFLPRVKPESRRRITRLALLTGMDSFGGGFLTSALIAFWFFRRFAIGEQYLGPLFFAARLANAASHLVAAWLARRIGLLNTIVLTHLPSSLFLMAVPLAPNFAWATVLFLCREALVEMDVPTRQSYIVAVVEPGERAVATGMSVLTRNVAYATAPVGAGLAMSGISLASPLFFGAGIKIAYDILLYVSFRRIKPPEEHLEARPEEGPKERKDTL
jgi:MFS family permease